MIQELKDCQTPVVGKYYLVRCAKMERQGRGGVKTIFVPIIGNKHNDPQFGAYWNHYHIDGRFILHSIGHFDVNEWGQTNQAVSADYDPFNGGGFEFVGIELHRKKCVRLLTGLNFARSGASYGEWYARMIGKPCKHRICPHKGAVMHERNGRWECPLHGLCGDIKTEKIVPRELGYNCALPITIKI